MGFNEKERESLVEDYEKTQTGFSPVEEETETSTESEESAEDSTETEEQTEASTETEEETETSAESEETEYTSEAEDTKDEKMVPYGALFEEREKRKVLSKKVNDLEGQLQEVLQDYRKVVDTKETETEEYSDPEMAMMRKEISELREFKNHMTKKEQESSAKAQQDELKTNVQNTDTSLEKEGFPGFLYATEAVGQKIAQLVQEDPENSWLYSPEGWAKVYKEHIFPELKGKFTSIHKDELFDKKKELKSGQKLATKTGKKPPSKKKDEDWSYNDYIKFRKSKTLG